MKQYLDNTNPLILMGVSLLSFLITYGAQQLSIQCTVKSISKEVIENE